MRRTFNYTGRRRIPRSAISINVFSDRGVRKFHAKFDLAGIPLPQKARVFIEAYYERAFERFDFGTVGNITPPPTCSLQEIDFGRRIRFRVKVVDSADEFARVLAVADGLVPVDADEDEGSRRSLLDVDPRSDMGHQIWRLDLGPDGPVLQVNAQLENVMQLFRDSPVIRALVYPEVLRSILSHILLQDSEASMDAADDWQWNWIKFATRISGSACPERDSEGRAGEEFEKWIEECVAAFAEKLRARHLVAEAISEGRL